jgi:hypothetical protein
LDKQILCTKEDSLQNIYFGLGCLVLSAFLLFIIWYSGSPLTSWYVLVPIVVVVCFSIVCGFVPILGSLYELLKLNGYFTFSSTNIYSIQKKDDILSKDRLGKYGIRGIFRDEITSHKQSINKIAIPVLVVSALSIFGIGVIAGFVYNLIYGYFFVPNTNFMEFISNFSGVVLLLFSIVFLFLLFIREIMQPDFNKIICPSCLKTVFINEIQFNCPFCHEFYGMKKNEEGKDVETADRKKALLYECRKCQGIIQYIGCPHPDCGKPIDLFAPYDEKKLEMKRYE